MSKHPNYCAYCGRALSAQGWRQHLMRHAALGHRDHLLSTQDDFIFCPDCGERLIPTTTGRCCPNGHGRIHPPNGDESARAAVKGADLKRAGDLISKYARTA